jgi:hypothetical protein
LRLAIEFQSNETTPGKQLKLEKSNCGSIKWLMNMHLVSLNLNC